MARPSPVFVFAAYSWHKPVMSDPFVIDARGHHCPVPVLKLQKRMKAGAPGETFVLIADDPMARIDVPHFCNQNQYVLQCAEPHGTGWRFEVLYPRP